jgi:hypothetical protein
MNTSNIKDWMTTLCGIIIAVCAGGTGFLYTIGITFPAWVYSIAVVLSALAVYVKANLVGKNPDGTTKTPTQVSQLNQQAANTQPKP